MLIYNPAFDIHHAIFRVVRLLESAARQSFEIDRIRVLDFFLLFPEQLESLRFPADLKNQRALFVSDFNPYRRIENPRRLFLELQPYQNAALVCLASYNFIEADKLKSGFVERTNIPLPDALQKLIQERNSESKNLVSLLSIEFSKLPFLGDGGLKDRSHLQDTRYDPL